MECERCGGKKTERKEEDITERSGRLPVNDGRCRGSGQTSDTVSDYFLQGDFVLTLFFVSVSSRAVGNSSAPERGRRCGDIMSIAGQGEREKGRHRGREGGRKGGARGGEGQLRMLVVSRKQD